MGEMTLARAIAVRRFSLGAIEHKCKKEDDGREVRAGDVEGVFVCLRKSGEDGRKGKD